MENQIIITSNIDCSLWCLELYITYWKMPVENSTHSQSQPCELPKNNRSIFEWIQMDLDPAGIFLYKETRICQAVSKNWTQLNRKTKCDICNWKEWGIEKSGLRHLSSSVLTIKGDIMLLPHLWSIFIVWWVSHNYNCDRNLPVLNSCYNKQFADLICCFPY